MEEGREEAGGWRAVVRWRECEGMEGWGVGEGMTGHRNGGWRDREREVVERYR